MFIFCQWFGFLSFEAEMPSLRLYRTFDESPLMFSGNLTDQQDIMRFVVENSVPLFGEWTGQSIKMYQKRKLPVVFIAVDPTEDETESVLETAKNLATEFKGQYSFTQLDGKKIIGGPLNAVKKKCRIFQDDIISRFKILNTCRIQSNTKR